MHKRKYVIEKQNTTATTDDYDYDYDSTTVQDTQTGGGNKYTSIVDSDYQKPRGGSRQDQMDTEEVRKRLEGFVALRTMQQKRTLTQLPLFKTWVRYINNETKQFRTGGLLMKVEYPDYITLVNTNKSLTWSVQLRDNTIFIRDPKETEFAQAQRQRERAVKDRLYEMYQNKELKRK
jgi:hypothetical protein